MPLVAGRATTVRVHIDTSGGYVGTVDGALLVERAGEEDLVLTPDNGPIPPGLGPHRDRRGAQLRPALAGLHGGRDDVHRPGVVGRRGVDHRGAGQRQQPQVANRRVPHRREPDGLGGRPRRRRRPRTGGRRCRRRAVPLRRVRLRGPRRVPPARLGQLPDLPRARAPRPGSRRAGTVEPRSGQRRRSDGGCQAPRAEHQDVDDRRGQRIARRCHDGRAGRRLDPHRWLQGWASNGVSWTQADGGTAAHEVAHVLGLDHVNCVGDTDGDGVSQEDEAGAIDWSHPNGLPPVCSLSEVDPDGFFGYTTYRDPATIYSNDPGHPQAAFPLMSYADPKWSDPYHYCRLLDATGVPCNPSVLGLPPADPFQVVECEPEELSGQLQLDLCISQQPAADVDDAAPAPGQLVAEMTTNSVGMETLQIAHDGFLFDVPIDPESWIVASGSVDVDSGTGALAQAVMRDELQPDHRVALRLVARRPRSGQLTHRFGAAAHRRRRLGPGRRPGRRRRCRPRQRRRIRPRQVVRVLLAGSVGRRSRVARSARRRDRRRQPTDQPDRSLGRRRRGRDDRVGSRTHTVHWEVDDPDPGALDEMTFTVLWSADGETWIPAAVDVTGTEVTIPDSAGLPGGDHVQVQVIANDGVRTGTATSDVLRGRRSGATRGRHAEAPRGSGPRAAPGVRGRRRRRAASGRQRSRGGRWARGADRGDRATRGPSAASESATGQC